MLIASHSRSSMGILLYLLGSSHHSRLPPVNVVGAAGDGADGVCDATAADTSGDGVTGGDSPFLKHIH